MDRKIVSREEWTRARKELLAKEKEHDRLRDALSAERRALPMVKVDEPYVFEAEGGQVTLLDLFGGRRQLIVYHFMFDPSWDDGCKSCSFLADTFDGASVHLPARDTSFVAVSRAPLAKLDAFKKRMGWSFRWVSSAGSDFNYDYQATARPEDVAAGTAMYNFATGTSGSFPGERPGASVFFRDGADVFHTYSTYARGLDHLIATYDWLDLTPLGRDEEKLPYGMAWVRLHDRYPPA
jgi:predicted dithiol-disulfide oxidoreductase (DUF899 family)